MVPKRVDIGFDESCQFSIFLQSGTTKYLVLGLVERNAMLMAIPLQLRNTITE